MGGRHSNNNYILCHQPSKPKSTWPGTSTSMVKGRDDTSSPNPPKDRTPDPRKLKWLGFGFQLGSSKVTNQPSSDLMCRLTFGGSAALAGLCGEEHRHVCDAFLASTEAISRARLYFLSLQAIYFANQERRGGSCEVAIPEI